MLWLKKIEFSKFIYPEHLMDSTAIPTAIFVPEKQFLRRLIKVAARCTNQNEVRQLLCAY